MELARGDAGLKNLDLVITYLLTANEKLSATELSTALADIDERLGALTMTLHEMLKRQGLRQGPEQGRRQGLRRGLEQGLEQGRQEGRQEVKEAFARKLLTRGMSPAEVAELAELPIDAVRALAH